MVFLKYAANLQNNFFEIAHQHGCSPVNLLHIFRTSFPKNTSGRLMHWLLQNIKRKNYNINKQILSLLILMIQYFCQIYKTCVIPGHMFEVITWPFMRRFFWYYSLIFWRLLSMVHRFYSQWHNYLCFCWISNSSNCRSQFQNNQKTLVNELLVQMYFQSSSEWVLRLRIYDTYDTSCLQFCRISNWSNCRSLFWSSHLTLVKLIIFVK